MHRSKSTSAKGKINLNHYKIGFHQVELQTGFDGSKSKSLYLQDVYDHLKKLDYAEREIMPVRLEYVKLKRQLEATEDKYLKMTRSQHEGLDQNQITIDNRVRDSIFLRCHFVMDNQLQ